MTDAVRVAIDFNNGARIRGFVHATLLRMSSTKSSRLPQNPGEALERQAQEKHFDWWLFLAGAATATVLLALTGWVLYFICGWRAPWDVTAVSIAFTCWFVVSFRRNLKQVRMLLLGAWGEREVAVVLDSLRSKGYHVFHGVPIPLSDPGAPDDWQWREGYSADHILIGPAGVFVVESKMRSHKNSMRPRIQYDGRRVLENGTEPDRCPVRQVTGYATGLGKYLRAHTRYDIFVRGVILYPGANVAERSGIGAGGRPWVLVPERFGAWLHQELRRPRIMFGRRKPLMSNSEIERLSQVVSDLCTRGSQ